NAQLHAAILKRSNHLKAGAVSYVTQTFESVSAECALQNSAVLGAVKQRAPLFQFAHALWRFLCVKLRHTPVVQELSATHGVAEMRAPVVRGINVSHGRGDSALRHDRMSFAEQRFANQPDSRALRERFNRGTQSGAAGTNDQNIMCGSFVGRGHRIRMSLKTPAASMRM